MPLWELVKQSVYDCCDSARIPRGRQDRRQDGYEVDENTDKLEPTDTAGTHKDKGLDLISATHHLQASKFGAAVILQDMLMPFNLEINIHHGLEVNEEK